MDDEQPPELALKESIDAVIAQLAPHGGKQTATVKRAFDMLETTFQNKRLKPHVAPPSSAAAASAAAPPGAEQPKLG